MASSIWSMAVVALAAVSIAGRQAEAGRVAVGAQGHGDRVGGRGADADLDLDRAAGAVQQLDAVELGGVAMRSISLCSAENSLLR